MNTLQTDSAIQRSAPIWRRAPVMRLLLIALLAEIAYAVVNLSAMPVYLKFDRGMPEGVIGVVVVAFLLSEAVFKSPMGHLADVLGRKRMIVLGPAITVCTSLATLAVPSSWGGGAVLAMIVLRMLDGLGAAMMWPATFAQMGDTVEDSARHKAMSFLNTCYLLGVALAIWLGGVVNDLSGTRAASFYLAALLFAAVATLAYWTLPSGRTHREARRAERASSEVNLAEVAQAARRIPAYIMLAAVTFAGVGFPMAIIKIFAEEQFRLSESAFGFLVLPGVGAMAILSVPMAGWSERIGRARAVHLGLGMCFFGITFIWLGAILPPLRGAWAMALGAIPVGLGFLMAIPAWFASISDLTVERRAANLGAIMTAQGVGAIVGAPLGSMFYQTMQVFGPDFGRYSPFLGCAVCLGIGWLLSLRLVRPHTSAQTTEGHQQETLQDRDV